MSTAVVLKSLIQESKDGEWGKGEPFEDSVKMAVIRGTDFEAVRNGNIDALPIRYIPKRIADRKTLQPNDILLETAGGSKDRPTGRSLFIRSSIIHRSELPLTCASFSRFIRIDPTKADPRYIFWHLQYLYDADYLRPYHTQHTGVARFQYTVFSEREELVIPPLPIQRKIAGILSAYDDLIENNTRRIEILEEMARSIYREWFVKFRFPGHEQVQMVDSELGLIPEGWEVKKLGEVIRFKNGKSIKVEEEGDYLVYGSNGIIGRTNEARYQNAIIIGRVGAYCGSLIYSKSAFNASDNTIIAESASEKISIQLAFYVLEEMNLRHYAGGAAQPLLTQTVIKEIPALVPDLKTNKKFQIIIANLIDFKSNLTNKIQNLRKTRDLLLPRLISGEIDVENLDINTSQIAA